MYIYIYVCIYIYPSTVSILSNIQLVKQAIQGQTCVTSIYRTFILEYPLVNKHSYGTWPFLVSFPIEHGDFP